jgi:hypothetical protein
MPRHRFLPRRMGARGHRQESAGRAMLVICCGGRWLVGVLVLLVPLSLSSEYGRPTRPRWWIFRCAKRISTRLRSSRDLTNSGVPVKARVAPRASSCTSRGIFRKVTLGVHLGLSGHEPRLHLARSSNGALRRRGSLSSILFINVRGWSAYPPILSVNANIPARQPVGPPVHCEMGHRPLTAIRHFG